jgi:hypothetical protein
MEFIYAQEIKFEADANDARGICEAIWRRQRFNIHGSVDEWMSANAKVAQNFTGQPCRSTSFEEHVQDLFKLGLLQQAKED